MSGNFGVRDRIYAVAHFDDVRRERVEAQN
jgi:hypothetical protein